MKRIAAIIITVALGAAAAPAQAVTLVNPDGTPVGGQWQRWVDEMRVPTIAGTLLFIPDNAVCPQAQGCSTGAPYGAAPETWVSPSPWVNARSTLYFELGHQFDWALLTHAKRRYLARHWGDRRVRWWDTPSRLAYGEDGLEGVFPGIYADCAVGINDKGGSDGAFEPFGTHFTAPTANPTINTCRYIDKIARRVEADMESAATAPWNRPHRHHR